MALTVLADPVLTTGPVDANLTATGTGTMTAVADGPAGVAATAVWQTAADPAGPWTDVPAAQVVTSGAGHVTSTFNIDAAVADGDQRARLVQLHAGRARGTVDAAERRRRRAPCGRRRRPAADDRGRPATTTTVAATTTTVEATTTTEAAATTSTTIQ